MNKKILLGSLIVLGALTLMFGFAIGADLSRSPWSWIILIPFVSIEFKSPYEKSNI